MCEHMNAKFIHAVRSLQSAVLNTLHLLLRTLHFILNSSDNARDTRSRMRVSCMYACGRFGFAHLLLIFTFLWLVCVVCVRVV